MHGLRVASRCKQRYGEAGNICVLVVCIWLVLHAHALCSMRNSNATMVRVLYKKCGFQAMLGAGSALMLLAKLPT